MTREEAVEKLEAFAPMVVDDTREALEMAIEALQTKGVGRYENAMQKLREMPRYLNGVKEKRKAEPVKHGEWEQHDGCVLCKDDDTYFYTCSCCKMAITEAERGLFNYCPNCGAKMRGSKILGKEAECIIDEANAYKREKGEQDD